jgi:hypothetical protein
MLAQYNIQINLQRTHRHVVFNCHEVKGLTPAESNHTQSSSELLILT